VAVLSFQSFVSRQLSLRDVAGGLGLNALIHLLAMHGYLCWCTKAEAHLAAFYAEHPDGHFVANLHGLPWTSGQNEHGASLDLILQRLSGAAR